MGRRIKALDGIMFVPTLWFQRDYLSSLPQPDDDSDSDVEWSKPGKKATASEKQWNANGNRPLCRYDYEGQFPHSNGTEPSVYAEDLLHVFESMSNLLTVGMLGYTSSPSLCCWGTGDRWFDVPEWVEDHVNNLISDKTEKGQRYRDWMMYWNLGSGSFPQMYWNGVKGKFSSGPVGVERYSYAYQSGNDVLTVPQGSPESPLSLYSMYALIDVMSFLVQLNHESAPFQPDEDEDPIHRSFGWPTALYVKDLVEVEVDGIQVNERTTTQTMTYEVYQPPSEQGYAHSSRETKNVYDYGVNDLDNVTRTDTTAYPDPQQPSSGTRTTEWSGSQDVASLNSFDTEAWETVMEAVKASNAQIPVLSTGPDSAFASAFFASVPAPSDDSDSDGSDECLPLRDPSELLEDAMDVMSGIGGVWFNDYSSSLLSSRTRDVDVEDVRKDGNPMTNDWRGYIVRTKVQDDYTMSAWHGMLGGDHGERYEGHVLVRAGKNARVTWKTRNKSSYTYTCGTPGDPSDEKTDGETKYESGDRLDLQTFDLPGDGYSHRWTYTSTVSRGEKKGTTCTSTSSTDSYRDSIAGHGDVYVYLDVLKNKLGMLNGESRAGATYDVVSLEKLRMYFTAAGKLEDYSFDSTYSTYLEHDPEDSSDHSDDWYNDVITGSSRTTVETVKSSAFYVDAEFVGYTGKIIEEEDSYPSESEESSGSGEDPSESESESSSSSSSSSSEEPSGDDSDEESLGITDLLMPRYKATSGTAVKNVDQVTGHHNYALFKVGLADIISAAVSAAPYSSRPEAEMPSHSGTGSAVAQKTLTRIFRLYPFAVCAKYTVTPHGTS